MGPGQTALCGRYRFARPAETRDERTAFAAVRRDFRPTRRPLAGQDVRPPLRGKPRAAIHDRYVMALAPSIRARLASSPAPATYPPRGVPAKRKRPPERADASFQRSPETRGRRAVRRK